MAETSQNPLISTTRASDSSPSVQLHPLVLLTISDCITRHTLRKHTGPIVGAILGAQDGQNVTMEVAFQAKLGTNAHGDVVLDDAWFSKRLEDCEYQHKIPCSLTILLKAVKLTMARQGRTQATTIGHSRLVHSRFSLGSPTAHPPDTFAYIGALH